MKQVLLVSLIVALGCNKPAEQATIDTVAPTQSAPAVAPASNPPEPTPAPATTAAASPAAAPAGAIATQETNWKGISVAVTEFRRKGNTLTAKVQVVNRGTDGTEKPEVAFIFDEVYLLDTGAGKKYNVLKDEKGAYIASLRSGWKDRWYEYMKPGDSHLLWMKFPAPPPDVKVITLQLPGVQPFEDLNIQD